VRFEWDEAENEINRTKHGISFRTAARVFADPNSFQYPWRIVDGEERWQAIGCVEGSLFLLTVMHTGLRATRDTWFGLFQPARRRTWKETL
jgi:uncharacterized protein